MEEIKIKTWNPGLCFEMLCWFYFEILKLCEIIDALLVLFWLLKLCEMLCWVWILKLCEMLCWVYFEFWNCVRCSVGFILNFEIVWDALLVLFWIFNLCDERRVRLDAWSTVKSHSWPKVQPQPLWSSFSGDASLDPFHPTSRRQCVKEEGMRQVN